eukprot:1158749-Pelagomonas_calceolata.AAC.2
MNANESVSGALTCTKKGAIDAQPTLDEVKQLYASSKECTVYEQAWTSSSPIHSRMFEVFSRQTVTSALGALNCTNFFAGRTSLRQFSEKSMLGALTARPSRCVDHLIKGTSFERDYPQEYLM